MKQSRRQFLVRAASVGVGGLLGACDRDGGPDSPPRRTRSEPVAILAGAFAVAAIAKAVGGDKVSIDWLRENDQSTEAWTPNADRRARVGAAQIILTTSDMLWMLPPDSRGGQTLIRLEALLPTPPPPTTEPADSPANINESIGYVWLDPSVANGLGKELKRTLSLVEPKWQDELEENVAGLERSIDAIVSDTVATQPTSGPSFLSIDPGFAPLARAFGFEPIDLPNGRPIELPIGASDRRWLLASAQEHDVKVLFVPVETQPGLILDLKTAVGETLQIETLDAFGSSAGSGRNTYQQILRYNLEQLNKARR